MPDRDTFDSRPHPPRGRGRRESQREHRREQRQHREQREHRRSRRERELQSWPPPEWGYAVDAPMGQGGQGEERKKKSRCCKRIRLYISLVFLAAYFALVALLVSIMLSERKLLEAPGKDSPECQAKLCPIESPCQIQENEARCVFVSVANLRAIEVILGLVVGVPLMICVPCTLHWFCRRLCGKSWGARPAKGSSYVPSDSVHGTILGRQDDMDSRASEDSSKALKAAVVSSPQKEAFDEPSDDGLDDGLGDLFTPLAKNPAEETATAAAENELDLLFAPKPQRAKPQAERVEAKVPSIISSALESEFSALFQRKPKRKGPAFQKDLDPAMSDLHSNFSEGMSVLFASLKQLQKKQAAMAPSDVQDVKPSASSERKLSAKMSAVGSPDFLDEDLGDPPDFFNYALRIAGKANGNIREEALERKDSEDSLGHLEPDELSELFHPPL